MQMCYLCTDPATHIVRSKDVSSGHTIEQYLCDHHAGQTAKDRNKVILASMPTRAANTPRGIDDLKTADYTGGTL